jgi:hypothetical protein
MKQSIEVNRGRKIFRIELLTGKAAKGKIQRIRHCRSDS